VKQMKNSELRNLSDADLQKKIKESKEELFNLKFNQASGSLDKPSRVSELRKLVARMKTILRERELNK
jgi:large subunit ribosomal protein L29